MKETINLCNILPCVSVCKIYSKFCQQYIKLQTGNLLDHHELKLHLPSDISDHHLQMGGDKKSGLEFQISDWREQKTQNLILIFIQIFQKSEDG